MRGVVAGLWRRCVFVHEVGDACDSLRSVTERSERSAAMAGVFDIDLDQPEENVSDDENEEVLWQMLSGAVTAESLPRAAASR